MNRKLIYFLLLLRRTTPYKNEIAQCPPLAGAGCSIKGKAGEGVEKVE